MKISVVMPARDRGELIRDSIDSIIQQSFGDWELIIVNDHSRDDDNTKQVVESFGDPRIKYFVLPDENGLGIVAARNLGNAMAEGEIIAVLDSDDIAYPDRLQKTQETFNNEGADIVYGIADYWDVESGIIKPPEGVYAPREFNQDDLEKINYIPHSTVAYKTQIGRDFPYNSFFRKGEDYEFYGRLSKFGYIFKFINEPLVKYRVHKNSVINQPSGAIRYTEQIKKFRGWN